MNPNTKTETLARTHSSGHQPELAPGHTDSGHGAAQPPRNIVAARPDTVITLEYSASCSTRNLIEEYSVRYPATSSPSPSGRSNGSRLVSAVIVTRYTANDGSSSTPYQDG